MYDTNEDGLIEAIGQDLDGDWIVDSKSKFKILFF